MTTPPSLHFLPVWSEFEPRIATALPEGPRLLEAACKSMEPVNRLSLLWVWASISAAFWMAPIAGSQPTSRTPPPPAPRLSLSPPNSTFAPGERVQLTCSPPERWRAVEFLFYKLKPGGQWDLQAQQKKDTWEVSTARLEPESTFACGYNERNSTGELLQSAQSNHRVVIVELPPAALSLDPKYPVYLQGEGVTLTCSAPEGQEVSGYLFYKEGQDQIRRELPSKGQGPYEAFRVDQSTAGKYSCAYWIQLSGQAIQSPHSSLVSVAITERPQPPLFSVSPKQEVYQSGEFISLTCLAPDRRQVSKVTFFKDHQRLLAIKLPSSLDDFTHSFPLLPQDGGRYSCKYQVVESEREMPSLMSNIIHISVMVPEPSTAVLVVHTYEATTRVTNSPGAPNLPALQLASSQPAVEENSHSAEPDRPETSVPRSSQPPSHDNTSSSTDSQRTTTQLDSQSSTKRLDSWGSTKPIKSWGSTKPLDSQGRTTGSRKTVTNSGDPRTTSQTRTESENRNATLPPADGKSFNLYLVAGCSAAGILFLAFLVCFFRRKLKGNNKRLSRSFWKSLDDQQSRQMSRIYSLRGTHLDLQETAKPQGVSQDWGVLPISKAMSSRRESPPAQGQADDDADSGAELEFPDMDPTYTLLSYPCSTFFLAESDSTAKDTHIHEEPL